LSISCRIKKTFVYVWIRASIFYIDRDWIWCMYIIIITLNNNHHKYKYVTYKKWRLISEREIFLFTTKNNDGLLWHWDRFSNHDNMSDYNELTKVPQTFIERENKHCLTSQSLIFVSSMLLLWLAFFVRMGQCWWMRMVSYDK